MSAALFHPRYMNDSFRMQILYVDLTLLHCGSALQKTRKLAQDWIWSVAVCGRHFQKLTTFALLRTPHVSIFWSSSRETAGALEAPLLGCAGNDCPDAVEEEEDPWTNPASLSPDDKILDLKKRRPCLASLRKGSLSSTSKI